MDSMEPFFSPQRTEYPESIADALRKALAAWDSADWTEEWKTKGVRRLAEKIGEGESPREAFRIICLQWVKDQPWEAKPRSNNLSSKIGYAASTHNLITRLSKEYEISYTALVREIVENWAGFHRCLVQERPEWDMNYDPEWEGNDDGGCQGEAGDIRG